MPNSITNQEFLVVKEFAEGLKECLTAREDYKAVDLINLHLLLYDIKFDTYAEEVKRNVDK